jgi:S-adenosylmethionine/arginine decarboxylase-like enzyme
VQPASFVHHLADYRGVASARAGDAALLSGLLIAAAGAAGLAASGTPAVHMLPSGAITAILLIDGCHLALHAFPERGLVLADLLVPAGLDGRKALDVLARRLVAADVRQAAQERG